MQKKIVFIYATREGQTKKIVDVLANDLSAECDITRVNLRESEPDNLEQYDMIIIGCSIRYGYYPKLIKNFIIQHTQLLKNKKTAFFGVNLVARKPNKNSVETNIYTRKFLSSIEWRPTVSAVFAGALYYPQYKWFDKIMIRFIMWLGKGDTDTSKKVIEYTDWNSVHSFSNELQNLIITSNQD